MKSTLTMRNTANPQRTTLAHLNDADELTTEAVAAHVVEEPDGAYDAYADISLPSRTANPRRTVLVDAPAA